MGLLVKGGDDTRVNRYAELISQLPGQRLSLGYAVIVDYADIVGATHRSPFLSKGVVCVRTG